MKINQVIDAFNKALEKIKTDNKHNPIFVSTLNIDRKLGAVKEFTIRIFLVDQLASYRSVVLKKSFTCSCPEGETEKVVEFLSIETIADLVLLFSKYKDDLTKGNYESLVDVDNGNKQ